MREQGCQLVEEAFAEVGDGAVVGVGVGTEVAKRNRVVHRLGQLAAGEHARGVAVKQQRHQHRRVVGTRAGAGIGANQVTQVELINNLGHEPRQMVFRQVLLHGRREHVRRVPIYPHKVDCHAVLSRPLKPGPIVPGVKADKSDRLLAAARQRALDGQRVAYQETARMAGGLRTLEDVSAI